MITLKIALIAMMIGSSVAPLNNGNINKAVECPVVSEVAVAPVLKDTSALDTKETADPQIAQVENIAPAEPANPAQQVVTEKERAVEALVRQAKAIKQAIGINTDKTYEQCMMEALERIYEEINRMLNEVVDGREEQF